MMDGKMKDFDIQLQKILDENIDISSQNVDVEKMGKFISTDKLNRIMLEYYNEKTGSDFQNELKESLGIEISDKLSDDIEKNGEKDKEEQIRDMSKETLKDQKVDKEVEKAAIKKATEKSEQGEKLDESDFKAELMKAVYEESFAKYATILEGYKKHQLKDQSMSIGDREGTELVLFERYLANIERNYAAYASNKGLESKDLRQDSEIKSMREKLEYEMKQMDLANDKSIDKNLDRIRAVSERRNEIAEEISALADNHDNYSSEDFKNKMDYFQDEYFDLTMELRSQDPTMEDYMIDLQEREENMEFASAYIIGPDGNSQIIAGDYIQTDMSGRQVEDQDTLNIEAISDTTQEIEYTTEDVVDNLIEEIEEAINDNDFDKADELLQSAEQINSGEAVFAHDSDPENVSEDDELIKEEMQENENPKSSFEEEMMMGVASDKEVKLRERLESLKVERDKGNSVPEIEDVRNYTPQISRFNRK